MNDRTLLRTGIIGSAVAAVCCITPVLLLLLTAVGASAVIGYLDFVLFPALGLFLALAGYAIFRLKRTADDGEAAS